MAFRPTLADGLVLSLSLPVYTAIRHALPAGIKMRLSRRYCWIMMCNLLNSNVEHKFLSAIFGSIVICQSAFAERTKTRIIAETN
jgi:hypothetical protein